MTRPGDTVFGWLTSAWNPAQGGLHPDGAGSGGGQAGWADGVCGGGDSQAHRGWKRGPGGPGARALSPMQPVMPSQGGEVPEDAKAEDAGQGSVKPGGGVSSGPHRAPGWRHRAPRLPTLSPAPHAEHKAPHMSTREEGPRPWAAAAGSAAGHGGWTPAFSRAAAQPRAF